MDLPSRKDFNQVSAVPEMPRFLSRSIKILWLTVSNATLRSNKITAEEPPASRILLDSTITARRAVSVP